LTLPALTALRKSFPQAKISWLVRPEFAPLLQNHPHLNEVIIFDRKFLGKAWFYPPALTALFSLIHRLYRRRFDLVFDFQGLLRSAALAWLSGSQKRYGMANAREVSTIFYTDKIPQDKDHIHLVDYYLKIVNAAGAEKCEVEFVLPSNEYDVQNVKKMLKELKVDTNNYAVLVPGSARLRKCWPVERFAALADKINSHLGLSVVAVGSVSENGLIEKLKLLAAAPVTNLAGRTTLQELVALIRDAKLVVSNDTGPGHIAAALSKPMVMVFGDSNPARVAPYQRKECIAAVEPFERGMQINSSNPRHTPEAVTVEQVYSKICLQIGGSK